MSANECLFCNGMDIKYKPESSKDFICSRCVQLLLAADQQDLKRAYTKALEKESTNKAKAIESFLIPEGINEQRKPVSKKRGRHSDRKGIVRTVGNKEKRIGRSKIPAPATVL